MARNSSVMVYQQTKTPAKCPETPESRSTESVLEFGTGVLDHLCLVPGSAAGLLPPPQPQKPPRVQS
ncbi:hypothetical protein INR49_008061 [Caranx melampygus]|nr:hypothetical protein INR49_008061 [Caranx melampygus]